MRAARPAFAALAAALIAFTAAQAAPPPKQADVDRDFAFYARTAQRRSLGANDRLFILHQIRKKYADAKLSLAKLDAEIRKWETGRAAPPAPAAAPKPAPPAPAAAPPAEPAAPPAEDARLVTLRIVRDTRFVKVVMETSRPVAPKALRAETADGGVTLLVDLPGAKNRLSQVSRNLAWSEGVLRSVVATDKDGGARVAVSLAEDRPYRILRADREITVEVRAEGAVPRAAAPASARETVRPGDLLDVDVRPARELGREIVVQPDGTVSFPLAGTFPAAGLSPDALGQALAARLAPYVSRPRVTVAVKRLEERAVFVTGKVTRAGAVPFQPGLTLAEAVARAGGFDAEGDRRAVKIYRGRADAKSFLQDADDPAGAAFPLEAGDIVEVQRRGDTVFAIGQVARPGGYPYRAGLTLLDLVSEAGGASLGAKTSDVKVFRGAGAKRQALRVNLARVLKGDTAADAELKPGDIVLVPGRALFGGAGGGFLPWAYLAALIAAIAIAA